LGRLKLVLLQIFIYIGIFLLFYFNFAYSNFEFSLHRIENISSKELIQNLKNREYLNQKIKVILKEEKISLIIEGMNYEVETMQKWSLLLFSFLLFLILAIIHKYIDSSINIFRMVGNYLLIITFALICFVGMEKMRPISNIDILELSQKELKNQVYELYVNGNNKNLYVITKEEYLK